MKKFLKTIWPCVKWVAIRQQSLIIMVVEAVLVAEHSSDVLADHIKGRLFSCEFESFHSLAFHCSPAYNLYFLISRYDGFRHSCSCLENCWEKEKSTCVVNKLTRNRCKYCRYEKCVSEAGMSGKWVMPELVKSCVYPNKRPKQSKNK